MAFDSFMKIAGIDGESTDRFHKNEIDVLSFSWGAAVPPAPSGQPPGRAVAEDFVIVHKMDKASPQLMEAICIGKHFPEATLTCRKAGTNVDYLKIKMTDILVSSISPGGSKADDLPLEEVSLNFQKVRLEYTTKQGEIVSAECDFTPVTE